MNERVTNVEVYIVAAPAAAQPLLREIRQLILDTVPSASEKISYGMPSYEAGGRSLVHFAAAKRHVGVYGLVHVDGDVPVDLAPYLDGRSTLRFRLDQPLPTSALAAALRRKASAA
jgi:uncharacterized protein YdhG (YjbR/CyaY superfamily)